MKFRHVFLILIVFFSWHQLILHAEGDGLVTLGVSENKFRPQKVVAPALALADEETQEVNIVSDSEPEPPRETCGEFYCYTGQEFIELFDKFEETTGQEIRDKYVYNHAAADPYIQNIAENRGYEKRTFADEDRLVWYAGKQTHPEVRDSFVAMKEEMAALDMDIHFVSGYRSSTHQRQLFSGKVGPITMSQVPDGVYDIKIDNALKLSALPGYSKHHTGFAVDVGCGTSKLVFQFAETSCYEWMSANNFENAKRHGFIPSYPYNTPNIGPNPEPWEFVYVGTENLI